MSETVIWRIDDRFIHGQVVVGWCSQLPIRHLVVCDNSIAGNEWDRELLLMAVPPTIQAEVLTVGETAQQASSWNSPKNFTMVILESIEVLQELLDHKTDIKKVIVGGIHYKPGRREYLSYVFLTPAEVQALKEISNRNITVTAQDLPTSTSHDMMKVIARKGH
ncbi:MAG: PTS sugar transporter subunit IIB [Calditrichia bacterium]